MPLPQPYHRWLEMLCGGPLPTEKRATCHDCAMCGDDIPGGAFHPEAKCCTYVPRVPNFLAGRTIEDTDPAMVEGRAGLLARLAEGVGISPLGIELSAEQQAAYDTVLSAELFGRTGDVRCPHHLPDGRCGIWKHRNGICATWFCRHEDGALGHRFWESVQLLLTEVERAIGYWVARRVRWPEGVRDEAAADRALFAGDWGPWAGRAVDFYRACEAEFSRLTWSRVHQVGGRQLRELAAQTVTAYAARTAELPERMQVAEHESLAAARGVDLLAYSTTDPLRVPVDLAAVLDAFDGRRVPEVLAELARGGVEIEPELLRGLRAFEVLLPADE